LRRIYPRSNALWDLGKAPISDLLAKGLVVGLGTDGIDSSLWTEMQAAYLLSPHSPGSPDAITPGQVGQMLLNHNSTIASRIFRAKVGELAIGAVADILLVRYPQPTPLPEIACVFTSCGGMPGARSIPSSSGVGRCCAMASC